MAAMRTAVVLCSLQCAAALQPTTTTRRMNAASGAPTTRRMTATSATSGAATSDDWDAIVVGSGIGGLSCAAILATAGKRVLVCEAHDRPGGVAHDYEVSGFTFEAASATRRSDRVDGVEVPRPRQRHDLVPAGSRTALPSTRASRQARRRTR